MQLKYLKQEARLMSGYLVLSWDTSLLPMWLHLLCGWTSESCTTSWRRFFSLVDFGLRSWLSALRMWGRIWLGVLLEQRILEELRDTSSAARCTKCCAPRWAVRAVEAYIYARCPHFSNIWHGPMKWGVSFPLYPNIFQSTGWRSFEVDMVTNIEIEGFFPWSW